MAPPVELVISMFDGGPGIVARVVDMVTLSQDGPGPSQNSTSFVAYR